MKRKAEHISVGLSTPNKRRRRTSTIIPMAMQVDVPAGPLRMKRKATTAGFRSGPKLSKRQKNEVKTLISRRSELKFKIQNQSSTAISSTASIAAIFVVGQGISDQQRIGDSLNWCGTLELNLQVVNGLGATGDNYSNVRVILFQWHPSTTDYVPVTSDILLAGPSTNPDIHSVYNHDNRQLYTIIHDKVYRTMGNVNTTNSVVTTLTSTGVMQIRIPTKRLQKKAQFTGGANTGTNQIFMIQVSDSALATHPTTTWAGKVFYRDS